MNDLTDLTWLTDAEVPVTGVVLGYVSADDGVTEVSDAFFFAGDDAVRLTYAYDEAKGERFLINGKDEEREDVMALFGAFDSLFVWPYKEQVIN